MPIPDFNIDDVLPPFLEDAPGGAFSAQSPYGATVIEVIEKLATSLKRCEILHGWLAHRAELRKLGYNRGFQWLDGSFVENKPEPNDLDIVTFIYQEDVSIGSPDESKILGREVAKNEYKLDLFTVNLSGQPEHFLAYAIYLFNLFSHKRDGKIGRAHV